MQTENIHVRLKIGRQKQCKCCYCKAKWPSTNNSMIFHCYRIEHLDTPFLQFRFLFTSITDAWDNTRRSKISIQFFTMSTQQFLFFWVFPETCTVFPNFFKGYQSFYPALSLKYVKSIIIFKLASKWLFLELNFNFLIVEINFNQGYSSQNHLVQLSFDKTLCFLEHVLKETIRCNNW